MSNWKLTALVKKASGRWVSIRFVSFVIVGLTGIVVQLAALMILYRWLSMPFVMAQMASVAIAMTSNFYLNNIFTYASHRLYALEALRGLISFYAVCSIGAVFNVGVATLAFEIGIQWAIASIFGAVVGSIFNYLITKRITWRAHAVGNESSQSDH